MLYYKHFCFFIHENKPSSLQTQAQVQEGVLTFKFESGRICKRQEDKSDQKCILGFRHLTVFDSRCSRHSSGGLWLTGDGLRPGYPLFLSSGCPLGTKVGTNVNEVCLFFMQRKQTLGVTRQTMNII